MINGQVLVLLSTSFPYILH